MSVSQIRGGMGNITNFGRIVAKRVKEGLYAGRNIGYGNNVSEDGGNKTRRHWKPNSHRKRLYSEVLDRLVSVNVTAHALRCIDDPSLAVLLASADSGSSANRGQIIITKAKFRLLDEGEISVGD